MPRRSLTLLLTTVLSLTITGTVTSSPAPAASNSPAAEATRVARHDETGRVGFIGTRPGRPIDAGAAPGASASAVATGFLRKNATSLGLRGSNTELEVTSQHRASWGGQTVRVGQVHDGIPVLGGAFTVALDGENDVLSVLGEASPIGAVDLVPATTAGAARRSAVHQVARAEALPRTGLSTSRPELMFYDPRLLGADSAFQSARLSWVLEVRSATEHVRHQVVVDAETGTVSLSFSMHTEARSRRVCDADNTATQLPCVAPVWTEASQPAGQDADVQAAFDFSGDTYDFFADRFGRDSLDDAGMALISTVDYCAPSETCPYANAFWNGAQMVYGDGFAAADDVVGHELAHGVTDFSSSLFYYMQSGAINESMSDIFGELIDQSNGEGNDSSAVRWLLGEDVPGFGALRDMADPPAFNNADRMGSALYYGGSDDNGGVHWNSGVSNKAAYLLTDGDTFNGHTVTGLGLTKTARLFYTANNDLLVSGSDFADLANALRQACTNLAGAGTDGFVVADCAAVEQAIQATEMDDNPTHGPTSVVAPCPAQAPVYTYRDDLESDTGQFTTMSIIGSEGWSYPQNPNGIFDATYATSGDTNIWGYNRPSRTDSALRMTSAVTIPPGAYLHFQHAYGFENDPSGTYDGGVIEYSTSGAGGPWTDAGPLFTAAGGAGGYDGTISAAFDNPLGGRSGFVGDSQGYGASRAALSSLAGQDVMFRWRIGTDGSLDDYGWFIDDVSILQCVAPDTTPPQTTITSGPAEGSTITTSETSFEFASSEAGSTFTCRIDGGTAAPCTSPLTLTGLTDGPHSFSVAAIDPAGNTDPTPAMRSYTVAVPPPADTTPPDTTLTSGPVEGSTIATDTATFGFTATEPGSTFACRLDGGPDALCTSPLTLTALTDGLHSFSVVATDAAGNTDPSPAVRTFTVATADTSAPTTTITRHPAKKTFSKKAVFKFRAPGESLASFDCRIDRKPWRPCSSPSKYRMKPGRHIFRVRAIDTAGNVDLSPATWKWRVRRR